MRKKASGTSGNFLFLLSPNVLITRCFLPLWCTFITWSFLILVYIIDFVFFVMVLDRVFRPDYTTRQVYEEAAKHVVLSVVSGINCKYNEFCTLFVISLNKQKTPVM